VAEPSPAECIRRLAAEQLARHDEAVRAADIRSGDPIEPVLSASRGLIEWTAQVAGAMEQARRPLSPESERLLADRVATLASAVMRSEAARFSRGASARTALMTAAGLMVLLLAGVAAGYQVGVRGSTITVEGRSGEIVGLCRTETIQPAPDGRGRVCPIWLRLDQADPIRGVGR
jgi:hypothetical protein